MEDNIMLAGHIRDLAGRAYQNDYITHTSFLGLSELAAALDEIRRSGESQGDMTYKGVQFALYGGYDDSERKMMFFLPVYMDSSDLIQQQQTSSGAIACIRVSPVNIRFADNLTHRDYLGALMNLGVERDQIGDILTDEEGHIAYLFTTKEMESFICKELIRVRHTSVKCSPVTCNDCDLRPRTKDVEGSVASERLDAVIALAFHLSRGEAQELVSREQVFIDGRTAYSSGYDLKEGERVSVRGHGKFRYLGNSGNTRKGRLIVHIALYI